MNWDAVGAIAEIFGAGGVIVSLIYLATQIRNQNKESRLAAMHEIAVGFREATSRFATADMATILVKAHRDFDSLTEEEATQLVILSTQLMRAWEEAYFQFDKGRLDKRNWEAMLKSYLNILSAPGIRRTWELRKRFLDEEFVKFVEAQDLPVYRVK